MTQYHVLASEGRQRYTIYTKTHKNLKEKKNNSASSLNTLHTAESAPFYPAFSPTTISFTPRCRRKREVWLHFFAGDTQNDPKMHGYEDNAEFHSTFSAIMLNYATTKTGSDWKIRSGGRIWTQFSKMLAVLCFVSISDCKVQKRLKSCACVALMAVRSRLLAASGEG